MLPLFRAYPRLADALPYVPLGEFPTPVERPTALGQALGLAALYVKRDDRSGRIYGGNKVRTLEFLLARAVNRDARRVFTLGFAGSNYALATAVYARQLGLRCTSVLLPQANAGYVRLNLLASHHHGADLCHTAHLVTTPFAVVTQAVRCLIREGGRVAFLPPGGSSPLGTVGYVNAAFELRDQIVAGELPEPDVIYTALGSMGTAAGLMLGLRAAGLRTRVVPIRIIEPWLAGPGRLLSLLRGASALLSRSDPGFPRLTWRLRDVQMRGDQLGSGYARFTGQGVRAARLLQDTAGIPANGAYTAKAFAALVGDATAGVLAGKVVLFWNTFNSRDLAGVVATADFRRLPRQFHLYFTGALQPLDRQNTSAQLSGSPDQLFSWGSGFIPPARMRWMPATRAGFNPAPTMARRTLRCCW